VSKLLFAANLESTAENSPVRNTLLFALLPFLLVGCVGKSVYYLNGTAAESDSTFAIIHSQGLDNVMARRYQSVTILKVDNEGLWPPPTRDADIVISPTNHTLHVIYKAKDSTLTAKTAQAAISFHPSPGKRYRVAARETQDQVELWIEESGTQKIVTSPVVVDTVEKLQVLGEGH
jgi:hypothetical protein